MKYLLKKYIISTLVLLCGSTYSQQGWYNINVQFAGGIYFKDLNNGIIGNYKTTNAGLSWIYMGQFTGGSVLSFTNLNTGYGVGGSSIVKTTNFGDNWLQQINPSNQPLNSIDFLDIYTGYACGWSGTLIKTTNGGTNWFSAISQMLFTFTSVFFTDLSTGYLIGYRGTDSSIFLKTSDSGVNWSAQRYPYIVWGRFTSMFFINANTGFIGASGTGGYILKTTNGGAFGGWNEIILPTANPINSIYFPSASTGYAACYGGQILKTTNGGNNWFLQTTGTGSDLRSIFFINDLTGYASGYDYIVLKTTNGGGPPIGIIPVSNEIPKDFRLEQNYPNPFNPNTKIKFQITRLLNGQAKLSDVKLVVFDVLGREIETLVNEQLKAGTYEADFDGTELPSGVYYYMLKTNSFTGTKKMVIIK